MKNKTEQIEALLKASKRALEWLDDEAIDLDGEPEELLAGIRLDLHEAIWKIEGRKTRIPHSIPCPRCYTGKIDGDTVTELCEPCKKALKEMGA